MHNRHPLPETTLRSTALQQAIRQLADPVIATHSKRFFKTGPGEYGEGDLFLGIRVPTLRQLVRPHLDTPLTKILNLLHSPWHEERLLALLLMVARFKRGTIQERSALHQGYLDHTDCINNWDLVDCSASTLVGAYLEDRNREILRDLAVSTSLWERRIAMLATWHFIRQGDFTDCFSISTLLLKDKHDLIHKAVGWMLREVGKKDAAAEELFLQQHYHQMPRTMLRYAIERMPETRRKAYLLGRA